jgi:hypothetical protein
VISSIDHYFSIDINAIDKALAKDCESRGELEEYNGLKSVFLDRFEKAWKFAVLYKEEIGPQTGEMESILLQRGLESPRTFAHGLGYFAGYLRHANINYLLQRKEHIQIYVKVAKYLKENKPVYFEAFKDAIDSYKSKLRSSRSFLNAKERELAKYFIDNV